MSPMPTLLSWAQGAAVGQRKGWEVGSQQAWSSDLAFFQLGGCEENEIYSVVLAVTSGIWSWITYFIHYLRHRKDLVSKTPPECSWSTKIIGVCHHAGSMHCTGPNARLHVHSSGCEVWPPFTVLFLILSLVALGLLSGLDVWVGRMFSSIDSESCS